VAEEAEGAYVVVRHPRFAWFEYEDSDDAAWFDRTFTSSIMGWTNLFEDLRGGGVRRTDLGHPDLDIVFAKSTDGQAQGFVAFPFDRHGEFLVRWLFNPGVNENASKLTTGSDATVYAELVSLSGHHSAGELWGTPNPNVIQRPKNEKSSNLNIDYWMRMHADLKPSGHLKYLMAPGCYTCSMDAADNWLPLLTRGNPVHGVLGYSKKYKGDKTGGVLMRNFGRMLQSNPKMTILDAWAAANRGEPWGAVLHETALTDTMEEWLSDVGLARLATSKPRILQFDATNIATGGDPVEVGTPDYQARFHQADGTEMNRENSGWWLDPPVGLSPGQAGSIVIKPNNGMTLPAGSTISIIFYYYRPQLRQMNLDTLLQFSPSLLQQDASLGGPRIQLLKDRNIEKDGGNNTGFTDCIEVRIGSGESQIKLDYTVKSDAPSHYKSDRRARVQTHGRFGMYVFPPGTSTSNPRSALSMYWQGVWLLEI
jgi:hypothetical protein